MNEITLVASGTMLVGVRAWWPSGRGNPAMTASGAVEKEGEASITSGPVRAANDNLPVDPAPTISALLRKREPVSDEAFDLLLSTLPRKKSRTYWSSVEAAQTAARLLREAGATKVLDAGSGAGKFCTVASLDFDRR